MKVRSRKTNRNTHYEKDDFLLKEFSKDKEIFVPDRELSCNECAQQEDLANHVDSPLSFLVKFKGDNSKDPKAIKAETSGFILPDDLNYEKQVSKSFFKSVSHNHYNALLTEGELRELSENLYRNQSSERTFTKEEVKSYLRIAHGQKDWQKLLNSPDRTRWRKFVGKALKQRLNQKFGKIDSLGISKALECDRTGFIADVQEVAQYGGFNSVEQDALRPHL